MVNLPYQEDVKGKAVEQAARDFLVAKGLLD